MNRLGLLFQMGLNPIRQIGRRKKRRKIHVREEDIGLSIRKYKALIDGDNLHR